MRGNFVEIRSYFPSELTPGDLVRPLLPRHGFTFALVLSKTEASAVLATLDGDRPFAYWGFRDEDAFLRVVKAVDLVIDIDISRVGIESLRTVGSVIVSAKPLAICLESYANAMRRPSIFSLETFAVAEHDFQHDQHVAYQDWALGTVSAAGEFKSAFTHAGTPA